MDYKILLKTALVFFIVSTSACMNGKTSEIPETEEEKVIINVPECANITDEFLRGECLLNQAREKLNEDICNDIINELSQVNCFNILSIEKKDSKICNRIRMIEQKNSCLNALALKTSNESICNMIGDGDTMFKCTAQVRQSPIFCKNIKDVKTHDWCLLNLALKLSNATTCEEIINVSFRDNCYLDYVKEHKLSALVCNRIIDDDVWAECESEAIKLSCEAENFRPKYGSPIEPRRKES